MQTLPPMLPPSGNQKIWAMLSHLSGFIGVPFILPLVVYFAMRRESDYIAGNAASALNFHLSCFIYVICCVPLCYLLIGIPLIIAVAIASLILSIVAAIKASDGYCYHYPLSIPFFR